MIDFDNGLSPWWQARVLAWMASICIRYHEPESMVEDWLSEAQQSDEAYLRWAMARWADVKDWPVFKLEQLKNESATWLRHHPKEGVL